MSKTTTTAVVIMVIATAALGVGGYFLYTSIDGAPKKSTTHLSGDKIEFKEDPATYRHLNSEDLRFTYDDLATKGHQMGYVPSVGNPTVMVVPVEFKNIKSPFDYRFNEKNLSKLDALFNGDKIDGTNDYYHSVSSFYKNSSYGKLNLNFEITDPFTPSITTNEFVALENDKTKTGAGTAQIVEDFYKGGTINGEHIDFHNSKYDSNNDGFVDGVWFVYNDNEARHKEDFWPYVFWYQNSINSVNNPQIPNISAYANCSVAFAYEGSRAGIDPHTFIHETGHLLGLDDYYTYDKLTNEGYLNNTGALGGLDMMDLNIGDHNAFSKTALGWTNPIIPTSSGTITLKPLTSSGECIILSNDFNDSGFSEYLCLEYYVPKYLNEFDAKHAYVNRPKYFTDYGIRLFHVDSRIAEINYKFANQPEGNYLPSNKKELDEFSSIHRVINEVAHSNTRSRNLFQNAIGKEDLIGVIPQNRQKVYGNRIVDNDSLFQAGEPFCYYDYSEFFPYTTFNDGSDIQFSFKILKMTENECTVSINI